MKKTPALRMLLCAAALLVSAPSLLAAGEPQRVAPSFDVKLGPGPAVEMTFALALSEVSSYPVTITAIGGAVEEQLWTGSLSEGVYQFQAPLTKITSGPLKLVLKTKVTNRTEGGGQSFVTYQKWEGTIR